MLDRFVVRFDPAAAYPEVKALRAALSGGDWAACRAVLDSVDPAGRTFLLRLGGEDRRSGSLPRRVLAEDPGDTAAAAMLAFQLIDEGWQIRTNRSAGAVNARQFAAFHEFLREAEHVLNAAFEQVMHDPALWVAALTVARGLEMGQAEARYRYDGLAAFDADHLPGQSQYLQQLCPKWSGSWPVLEEFAYESMLAAPEGAPNAVLVVEGHLERWLAHDRHRGFFKTQQIRDSIDEAAARSVRHPDFQRTIGWVRVVNSFAQAYSLLGDRASAAEMFALLGPYGSREAWSYSAGGAFRRSRALANGWGGGWLTGVDAVAGVAGAAGSYAYRYVTR